MMNILIKAVKSCVPAELHEHAVKADYVKI
jgi:hypothetical protein